MKGIPRFKIGDRVYRTYPEGYEGVAVIASEAIYIGGTLICNSNYWYHLSLDDKSIPYASAWESHLIPEEVYNSPLYKLLQETEEDS